MAPCWIPLAVSRLGLEGALVIYVAEGSAAEKAGIRPTTRDRSGAIAIGDIIVQLGRERIKSNNDLLLALEKYKPGDVVPVRVLRGKSEVELSLKLDPAQ